MTTLTTLTALEQLALTALLAESKGNGHDFGLLEEVKWEGTRKQLGALVTNLIKKDIIVSIDEVEVNDGECYTQYVLANSVTGRDE